MRTLLANSADLFNTLETLCLKVDSAVNNFMDSFSICNQLLIFVDDAAVVILFCNFKRKKLNLNPP
jgi:hypothetical protein